MESPPVKPSLWKTLVAISGVLGISFFITIGLFYFQDRTPLHRSPPVLSDVGSAVSSIFSSQYPANARFKEELERLRTSGTLRTEHEILINRWISATTESIKMPPAILWCLLFQESRLNHLSGLDENKSSSGLGQFSYYSFYEVNHHLDKFTKDNLLLFTKLLGKDVRPIEARKGQLHHPSSYYFIPTAVISSAAYLNNRYYHIASILEKHRIPYDPQILWFYAAMAYNKGTRSVLSFWNQVRKRGGTEKVERLVLESATFHESIQDPHTITKAMNHIWTGEESKKYAKELKIHMANLKECVLPALSEKERDP